MIKIKIELADTPIKRSYGLMDRKKLEENTGMLFVFPNKTNQVFWMQNTYIPLDIALLDDSGKIMQIESMVPMSTKLVVSDDPCKYALEMNKGWFLKNKINVGFQIFKGDNWVKQLKRGAVELNNVRVAQALVEEMDVSPDGLEPIQGDPNNGNEPEFEPNNLEGELTPEQEQMYQQPVQPNKVVEYNMNQTAKIKYAEKNNKAMDMVYWTISGRVMPPRRIMPVPNEGYPIKNGPNGSYFVGYDSSPTIQGSGWEIKGGIPKNFLINGIISLEIVLNEGKSQENQEQTIEEPQNLWDRFKKRIFNR